MPSARKGSIHLFCAAGVDVYLHWSWFLVAAYEISDRKGSYSSIGWNIAEYLALFLIVLLHEFGHALACRQVGGTANQIVLWPLGGVAYVDPPPRPGATLWSIAAGPLVNVALLPILYGLGILSRSLGWAVAMPNAHALLRAVFVINLSLLAFNILPIYPLDGGQILRSLLWFVMGRARSLMAATIIGFLGGGLRHSGRVDTVHLVRSARGLYAGELLEWMEARTCLVAPGQAAATRRLCLPLLQLRAAYRSLLEVWQVRPAFRHISSWVRLPELQISIPDDDVLGLPPVESHERVECAGTCNLVHH